METMKAIKILEELKKSSGLRILTFDDAIGALKQAFVAEEESFLKYLDKLESACTHQLGQLEEWK